LLKDKRILLIISGGIAAYKSLDLIRRLKAKGADVTGVLTKGAQEFITPLSVTSLTGNKAHSDLFDAAQEGEMGHIELSRSADLIVVAPATANLMARMAHGLADDLASTLLLATDKPVMIAPAMNVRMWQHGATQRNLEQLRQDNIEIIGPVEGDMACGEYGPGRMSEPEAIVEAVDRFFEQGPQSQTQGPLTGLKVLITAGPTHEPIDPVRYIANRSSGKQGFALAQAASRLGAKTILVTGPSTLKTPTGVTRIDVETAQEMLDASLEVLPVDIGIFAAAVADWRPKQVATAKLKKKAGKTPALAFTENPDILKTISTHKKSRPRLVIGFAAETHDVSKNAQAKRKAKGCDWIVANDVSPESGIFGGDVNRVELISEVGSEAWPEMSKQTVAEKLLKLAADHLTKQAQKAK